jgi:hypothetical protein
MKLKLKKRERIKKSEESQEESKEECNEETKHNTIIVKKQLSLSEIKVPEDQPINCPILIGDFVKITTSKDDSDSSFSGTVVHSDYHNGSYTIHTPDNEHINRITNKKECTYITLPNHDIITVLRRRITPIIDIDHCLHNILQIVETRKKTKWEKSIDANTRALIVHMGWRDKKGEDEWTSSKGACPNGLRTPTSSTTDTPIITKRILPLHLNDDNATKKSIKKIKSFIHNGEKLRNALDSLSLHSVEDEQFHDLVNNDDYFDTSVSY